MISLRTGNLFSSAAEALVNPVNCRGVSGAGLAREFKRRFPENFILYERACRKGLVKVGEVFAVAIVGGKTIFNFPTKDDWREPSQLPWIVAGLADLRNKILDSGVRSVAVPALGCGLGGLVWADVFPAIELALVDLPVEIFVYPPR